MAALSSAECCESQTSPCTTGKGYQRRWQLHLFFFWLWDDNWSKRSNTRSNTLTHTYTKFGCANFKLTAIALAIKTGIARTISL